MKVIGFLLCACIAASCSHSQNDEADTTASTALGPPTPPFIDLCGHTWTTRNLDVATYRNGDRIPQVTDAGTWVKQTTGAWCWYNNDSANYHAFGRLYNWYAVNDARGLAPEGWHVLSDTDWEAMETCLGEDSVGYRMRASGGAQWPGSVNAIDNSSGFAGLPSGMRSDSGAFSFAGHSAVYWTSVEGSVSEAFCGRLIHHVNNAGVASMVTGVGYMNKADGYAVCCVKDP